MPDLNAAENIVWTLVNTEDWGGGLERTYRAENVEHAGCGGDVLVTHIHDEGGAVLGAHSSCRKCDENLTPVDHPAPTEDDEAEDDSLMACGEGMCQCSCTSGHPCGCDCQRCPYCQQIPENCECDDD